MGEKLAQMKMGLTGYMRYLVIIFLVTQNHIL